MGNLATQDSDSGSSDLTMCCGQSKPMTSRNRCDRGVPTSPAVWVVPRAPGGLISVAAAIQAWEPVVPALPSASFSECRPRTQALGTPFPGLAEASKADALYVCKARLKSGVLEYRSKES